MRNLSVIIGGGFFLLTSAVVEAQVVHTGGVSIHVGACVGNDCISGENFGFDTGRYKENNLRIHFDDTSASASFPANDWRIVINDPDNGGGNYFAVEDSTAGRVPFKIEAGARTNALYVDSDGDVGIGTANPQVDLHVADGNTPTLRLEQDGSSGFTPQTWDVAGNEADFFIRDFTNGNRKPFRIRTGAPTSSIHIADTGNVGFGTASPSEPIHVRRSDGTARIFVEETNATAAPRTLFQIANNGNTKFGVNNTEANVEWAFANPGTGFRLSRQGSGVVEMEIFNNGNMEIAGALTQNSDINVKTAITAIDPDKILAQVASLDIKKWEYKDARGEAHIGPMAQDFYAAFNLGGTETGISTIDTAGVALVAIQQLTRINADQVKINTQLKLAHHQLLTAYHAQEEKLERMGALEQKLERMDALEQTVSRLVQSLEGKAIYTSLK